MDRSAIEQIVRDRILQLISNETSPNADSRQTGNLIIAGNWKMNMCTKTTKKFINDMKGVRIPDHLTPIIIPPYPYLYMFRDMLRYDRLAFGAQDVAKEESGAYTGEVSASMLADIGCSYAIVGHSERRNYYADTKDLVGKKALAALSHGMVPIICIGDTKEERQSGLYKSVLKSQLDAVSHEVGNRIGDCIVAYEPIWSIDAGVAPTMKEIGDTHDYIHDTLVSYDQSGAKVPILFGGSVNEENVREIATLENVGGFLIDGASLKSGSYTRIIEILS